jgi:hypothetical protein
MPKWLVYFFLTISFLLVVFIIGGQYWLKRLENKESGAKLNKVVCEFNGKSYQQNEGFIIRFGLGCSFCVCESNGFPTCQKSYCPEGALNEYLDSSYKCNRR